MTQKFIKIGLGTPQDTTVLLYWQKSKHVEDGQLYVDEDGNTQHMLFDGERLNDEPTHWMYVPEVSDE